MKEKLLVSACLLGIPCRYDGNAKPDDAVCALKEDWELIPICPETAGGLLRPREPAEQMIVNGERRVLARDGNDVTDAFEKGAQAVLKIAKKENCRAAVMKENSPSCGYGMIYDGSFTGKKIPGNGVAAQLLSENGVQVVGEHSLFKLPKKG